MALRSPEILSLSHATGKLLTKKRISLNLGITEFIVPAGSFFHAQICVSFQIIEELSPNVSMIPKRMPYQMLCNGT
jgi:hypothetical protein